MGRRSQKSRSGQPRDRSKRTLTDKENPDNKTHKVPDTQNADSAGDDASPDWSSKSMSTDEPDGDEAQQDSLTSDTLDSESADAIAAGYASIEADQKPQTCCSNCKTIFEVTPELLSSSDTRVRCGECLGIFDALANLRRLDGNEGDEFASDSSDAGERGGGNQSCSGNEGGGTGESNRQDSSVEGTVANDTSLDVTYADFSLFSADAALPEVEYLDETREIPAFDFDDTGGDGELDETYSETLFAHGPEVDARSAINETESGEAVSDESADSAIHENTRGSSLTADQSSPEGAASRADATLSDDHAGDELDDLVGLPSDAIIRVEQRPVGSWWLRASLLLLVLILAAALYAYRERESLQHSRTLRPALESVCAVIGCTLAEPVDLASLQVLKRSVFSHPKLDDVLVINVGFTNQASFGQRFPVLEIRLTDRSGALVARNSFEPSDYLDNWQPGDVFDVGKRLDVSLDVKDPGNRAMSFELNFR